MNLVVVILTRLFALFIFCGFGFSVEASAQNGINGTVFGESRRPASDVEVELLDEFERFVKSTKTRSSGVYMFQNIQAGVFYIHVRTGGTNYADQKVRVSLGSQNRTVQTSSGARVTGVDVQQVNVYLRLDPRIRAKNERLRNEVLFAQDIPKNAKKIFEAAMKLEKAKKPKLALTEYAKALDIFPDYFLALMRFGLLSSSEKRYDAAEIAFGRAARINAKSSGALFQLAVVQNRAGKKSDAESNLLRATGLNSETISYFLLLGIIQRDLGKYVEAETALKKADELSSGKEPDVHWNLGLLYFNNLKRYREAAIRLELYLKTSKSMPKDERAKVKKTIALIKKKADKSE